MNATAAISPVTHPRPDVLGGVAPYLTVDGAIRASELYQRAFGAEEVDRVPPDQKGRTMHVHLYVNGGSLMLTDAYPEHGHALQAPQGFSLHLQVKDLDAAWRRAVDAGLQIVQPLQVMFWGDRFGVLRDAFGVIWTLGARQA